MFLARNDFPYLKHHPRLVYLDSAATSQKPQPVIDEIVRYYCEFTANVHRGGYALAEKATEHWEQARSRIAAFLGCASDREIVFTRGATEGLNLLSNSLISQYCTAGDRIVVSGMEHHSNLLPWQVGGKRAEVSVDIINYTADGLFDIDHLAETLTERTRIVAVTACSNVFGVATQLDAVVALAKKVKALVVVDAVQLPLHRSIDVQRLGADFLVVSGHKLLGPTGIGALWGRSELLETLPPWHYRGEMVEEVSLDSFTLRSYPWKFEAGTPPIAQAIGFGRAVDYICALDEVKREAHSRELASRLFEVFSKYPEIKVYGSLDPLTRFGPVVFNLEGVHPHDLSAVFNSKGVAIRAGGHCAHPVMQRLGVNATARISFGPYNTVEELDIVDSAIAQAIKIFRRNK